MPSNVQRPVNYQCHCAPHHHSRPAASSKAGKTAELPTAIECRAESPKSSGFWLTDFFPVLQVSKRWVFNKCSEHTQDYQSTCKIWKEHPTEPPPKAQPRPWANPRSRSTLVSYNYAQSQILGRMQKIDPPQDSAIYTIGVLAATFWLLSGGSGYESPQVALVGFLWGFGHFIHTYIHIQIPHLWTLVWFVWGVFYGAQCGVCHRICIYIYIHIYIYVHMYVLTGGGCNFLWIYHSHLGMVHI